MVGKLVKDKHGWSIIHEQAYGGYVWRTPYRLVPDQDAPEEWVDGDIVEFELNGPSFDTITITNKSYQTGKIDII
jgi:capsular polysaccharide biosynthesis protein